MSSHLLSCVLLLCAGMCRGWTPYMSSHTMDEATVQAATNLPFFPRLTASEIVAKGLLPAAYKLAPPEKGKKVPRIIWVAVANASEELPGSLKDFFARNSGWQVNIIGNAEKDEFIDTVFADTSVQLAYHLISPLLGAAKADIWRYAVLWLYGGMYIDYDSDIKTPLDEVVRADDTLIVSQEGSNYHECWIPTYPLSDNSTFSKFGKSVAPASAAAAYVSGSNPETGNPIFFDGKFIVQWAIIAAPSSALFHRTLGYIVDLLIRDYFRETVILLRKHTHRMLQLLCTTNYVFTASLRQLVLEGSASGVTLVRPRVLHDDWREYKGKCKAIWTGNDPTHYRKIMRVGHRGHDLLRGYASSPALLQPAAKALEGWAVSANSVGRAVYVVRQGLRRVVPDYDTFLGLGLTVDLVLHVPDAVFALIPEGPPIKVGK